MSTNDSVREYLTRIVKKGRIPNSLLFSGPENAGKKEVAFAFARQILKTTADKHPDLHLYRPEGKIGLHSIASMRAFNSEVYLAPFEAKHKVFIILEADRMLPTSANALLKTFEEPASDSIIILVSSRPEKLLPTILSRCQTVRFQAQPRVHADEKPDPLAQKLLEALFSNSLQSYANILHLVDQLSEALEIEFKEYEIALRGTVDTEQFTAVLKDTFNKEVEGAVAMQKKARVKELFHIILSWYRDLHLIQVNGNRSHLMNHFFEKEMLEFAKKGVILKLEQVQLAVTDALLSLERSTSLKICMENLFLRLVNSN